MMNGGRGWRNNRQMGFSHRRNLHPPHHEFTTLTYAYMAGETPFQGWADKTITVRSNAPRSSSVGFCFFSMSFPAAYTVKLLHPAGGFGTGNHTCVWMCTIWKGSWWMIKLLGATKYNDVESNVGQEDGTNPETSVWLQKITRRKKYVFLVFKLQTHKHRCTHMHIQWGRGDREGVGCPR